MENSSTPADGHTTLGDVCLFIVFFLFFFYFVIIVNNSGGEIGLFYLIMIRYSAGYLAPLLTEGAQS